MSDLDALSTLAQRVATWERLGVVPADMVYALEYGQLMPDSVALSTPREKGRVKECFANAGRVALTDPQYRYVEGFALSSTTLRDISFLVHHAWLINPDGNLVDPTWEPGGSYFGVVFSHSCYSEIVAQTGVFDTFDFLVYGHDRDGRL